MKIFMVDTANRRKVVEVNENDKIKNIKDKIMAKSNISNINEIKLLFNGEILEDNETVNNYEIVEYNHLTYLGKFKGGKYL